MRFQFPMGMAIHISLWPPKSWWNVSIPYGNGNTRRWVKRKNTSRVSIPYGNGNTLNRYRHLLLSRHVSIPYGNGNTMQTVRARLVTGFNSLWEWQYFAEEVKHELLHVSIPYGNGNTWLHRASHYRAYVSIPYGNGNTVGDYAKRIDPDGFNSLWEWQYVVAPSSYNQEVLFQFPMGMAIQKKLLFSNSFRV